MSEPAQIYDQKTKILEFDILRSIAILLLLLHHGGVYNFLVFGFPLTHLYTYTQLYLLGSFIFLSGYLSISALQKRSLKAFFTTRIVRIYIPYVVALLLFLIMLEVKVSEMDLAIHLLGAQMVLSPKLTTPILTLWFVGLILVYYGIFGVLLKTFKNNIYLMAAILLVLGCAAFLRTDYDLISRRFFYYYLVYAAGVLLARSNLLDKLTTSRYYLLDKAGLAVVGVVLLAPLQSQVGEEVSIPLVLVITFYILAMVLLSLSMARKLVQTKINIAFFSFVSSSSFFAYLLHRPIWDIGLALYQPKSITQLSLYVILLGYLVVVPVSYWLQKYYNNATATIENWTGWFSLSRAK